MNEPVLAITTKVAAPFTLVTAFVGVDLLNWLVILLIYFCGILGSASVMGRPMTTLKEIFFGMLYVISISAAAHVAVSNIEPEHQLYALGVGLLCSLLPAEILTILTKRLRK